VTGDWLSDISSEKGILCFGSKGWGGGEGFGNGTGTILRSDCDQFCS